MSEWWTYQASDFLMYSPQIYWRLFSSINQAFWPAQPLLVIGALAWLACWRQARDPASRGGALARSGAALLASCWFVVAWAFLWQRFAPINWIAGSFAWGFALQGLLLLVLALSGRGLAASRGRRRHFGLALGSWALLGHPLIGWFFGRPWQQAEAFGLAPDPTAIATLAFLLLIDAGKTRLRGLVGLLWLLPLSWCLASAAMFWTMGDPQGWLLFGIAIFALLALLPRNPKPLIPTSGGAGGRSEADSGVAE